MEGLKGTAIRLAVRDPSCPQAPVLPRARRHPALVRGCSCRWLRTRPASRPARAVPRRPPGVSLTLRLPRPGTGTWISPEESQLPVRKTGSRYQPRQPDPADLCAGIHCPAPRRHRSGRQAPPSAPTTRWPGHKLAVAICPLGSARKGGASRCFPRSVWKGSWGALAGGGAGPYSARPPPGTVIDGLHFGDPAKNRRRAIRDDFQYGFEGGPTGPLAPPNLARTLNCSRPTVLNAIILA